MYKILYFYFWAHFQVFDIWPFRARLKNENSQTEICFDQLSYSFIFHSNCVPSKYKTLWNQFDFQYDRPAGRRSSMSNWICLQNWKLKKVTVCLTIHSIHYCLVFLPGAPFHMKIHFCMYDSCKIVPVHEHVHWFKLVVSLKFDLEATKIRLTFFCHLPAYYNWTPL